MTDIYLWSRPEANEDIRLDRIAANEEWHNDPEYAAVEDVALCESTIWDDD